MPEDVDRLKAIRDRELRATIGPWRTTQTEGALLAHCYQNGINTPGSFWRGNTRADGEFIAHAREDIPWLLARLTAVEQEKERAIEQLAGDCHAIAEDYTNERRKLAALTRCARALVEKLDERAAVGYIRTATEALRACLHGETPAPEQE